MEFIYRKTHAHQGRLKEIYYQKIYKNNLILRRLEKWKKIIKFIRARL
ncbi:MAG: hypothetical protein IJA23_04135 [Clostridia bacterium]|nr:hypothetical protein [Clostridia bacterium]